MKSKNVCQSILEKLLTDETENLADDISLHLAECEKCRLEYEKIKKTRKLISASAPDIPDLRSTVTEKIKSGNITIDKRLSSRRRRHIPIGTIAAAAAILAVYVSVYGTKLPDMVFKGAGKTDESIMLSDNITAAPDVMMNAPPPTVSGANAEAADENEMFEKGSDIYYSESLDANKATANDAQSQSDSSDGANILRFSSSGGVAEMLGDFPESDNEYDDGESGEKTSEVYKSKSGYITKGQDVLMSYPTMNVLGFISGNSSNVISDSAGYGYTNQYYNQSFAELDGEEIFEIMSQNYPDRISRESFDAVGGEIYKNFVLSLSDYETEYTEEGLLEYYESCSQG